MNLSRRLAGLQERMEAGGIDLVVYGSCQNFQYLTGLPVEWRRDVDLMPPEDNVFVPREGEPILTLAPFSERHGEDSWIGDTRVLERDESYSGIVKKVAMDLGYEGGSVWETLSGAPPEGRWLGASRGPASGGLRASWMTSG